MTEYKRGKEKTIELAFEFLGLFENGVTLYWSDIAAWEELLTKRARRYGLIKEFRENGII